MGGFLYTSSGANCGTDSDEEKTKTKQENVRRNHPSGRSHKNLRLMMTWHAG